ncbi:MAG: hypothetical protein NTV09_05685, partial [Bacteroidetes bacterium]|nr:hypothetical protein [Bacteroidota bacterium]
MKSKLSILFCCFQLAVSVYAQKRNNQWILGGTHYRNCYKLDFNSGFPDTSTLNAMGFYDFNTSICDTSGQILFYSNGVEIANRDHDTLSNSQGFNPGTLTTNNNDGLSIT